MDGPEDSRPHAEEQERHVRLQAVPGEDLRVSEGDAARQPQHQAHHQVIGQAERHRRQPNRQGHLPAHDQAGPASHQVEHGPGGQHVEQIRGDIESLDVPRVPVSQPLRQQDEQAQGHQQRRLQQEDRCEQKGGGRVVGMLVGGVDLEQLSRRSERAQHGEGGQLLRRGTPAGGGNREGACAYRTGVDGPQVQFGEGGQRPRLLLLNTNRPFAALLRSLR